MSELMEAVDEFQHMLKPDSYGGSIYILLVEDSLADAELFTESMRSARYSNLIEYVHDGEAAWARLQDKSKRVPDWVVVDLDIPKITGEELIEKMSQSNRLSKSRWMILSGHALTDEQREKFKNLKVDFFFLKPLNYLNIQDMVKLKPQNVWFDIYKRHETA